MLLVIAACFLGGIFDTIDTYAIFLFNRL